MTTLGALLRDAGIDAELPGAAATLAVTTVELDSRQCTAGSVFVCMEGTSTRGDAFVGDALERGAVCVVASTPVDAPVVVHVQSSSMRHALAALSSAAVGHPASSLTLAGITGTNGKTTVAWLLGGVLNAVGYTCTTIGTLTGARTTPAAPDLHRALRAAADTASTASRPGAVALEVSSHALDQGRVDGLLFDVAVFTNLSHEHLDYHGSMERYFEAKANLFEPDRCAAAVVCVDDEWGRALAARSKVPTVEVASAEATLTSGALGRSVVAWRGRTLETRLTGRVNVTNAILTLAAAEVLGVDDAAARRALADVPSVPGRLELVDGGPPSVLVDYAHSPDALDRVLRDLRALAKGGRVVVVFGCGGERDKEKRPQMGLVASSLADEVIVTSDNPRSEDPRAIIDAVVAGATGGAHVDVEVDRRAAVERAVAGASATDVVLLAGKGHETTQEIAGERLDLDDAVLAREALGRRGATC